MPHSISHPFRTPANGVSTTSSTINHLPIYVNSQLECATPCHPGHSTTPGNTPAGSEMHSTKNEVPEPALCSWFKHVRACSGGRYWARTSDLHNVTVALYQLSQSPGGCMIADILYYSIGGGICQMILAAANGREIPALRRLRRVTSFPPELAAYSFTT